MTLSELVENYKEPSMHSIREDMAELREQLGKGSI